MYALHVKAEDMNGSVNFGVALLLLFGACSYASPSETTDNKMIQENGEVAVFGAGCFWCVEPIFAELKGVSEVEAGYAGGHVKNPAYREVCTGRTGHAEVIRIVFDPKVISYAELLEVFWKTHDPTTLNRQGADRGTQYRSVVFYANETQEETASALKKRLDESGAFSDPIVTEIAPLEMYFTAEQDHQDYFVNNPEQAYCRAVIQPKMEKFRAAFSDKLK